jgi:hypothetical protein
VTDSSPDLFSQTCHIADLFKGPSDGSHSCSVMTTAASRYVAHPSLELEAKLDVFAHNAAACCALRFTPARACEMTFFMDGAYSVATCKAGGWLLLPEEGDLGAYWLPQPSKLRLLDEFAHIRQERPASISSSTVSSTGLAVKVPVPEGWVLDCTMWRFPPGAQDAISQLRDLGTVELQARFLWGSHTLYQRPCDVYVHMVHGHVYENRFSWPKHWKICSENDAHALYTILSGLEVATGKQLYCLLKQQLQLAVIERQGKDGGWRHGEWTDRMESHYRLHCSAMHLLMDALAESDEPEVCKALERAAGFLARQTDKLDVGIWFLHDGLEHSVEAMQEGPFRWLPSRALGKSESNMLVLNSHLDATVALDRYREVAGDARYQSLVAEAVLATRTALSLRPADWLYKPLFRAIRLTFLPAAQAARLPLHLRALKRVAWKYLIPLLPRIKALSPRIAMPGGYIDRELSMRIFAVDYLPINLMDLLRYRCRFPDEQLDDVILPAIRLVQECRMIERWPEINGKEYALGFWAETLYQACLAWPDAEYRVWLARAVVALEKRALGLPPSLLGANSEAVAPSDQAPTPVLDDARIRVVNLSRRDFIEVILVNCSDENVHLRFLRNAPAGMAWTAGNNGDRTAALPHQIQAGDWLWGHGERRAGAVA